MPTISRRLLGNAIANRLTAVTNATGYYGQISALNGLPGVEDTPADPPPKSADDPRVRPYFVVFPGIGRPGDEDSAAGHTDTFVDLDWPVGITAAGGDVDDVLALVDRIDALLYRWTPASVDGVLCGPLRYPPGRDVPLLIDHAFKPVRHYAPLQYQLTAHT